MILYNDLYNSILFKNKAFQKNDRDRIIITVRYEKTNAEERLSIGGLTPSSICYPKIERKYLKPRYVETNSLGRIVFFSFEKMIDYVKANKDDIYQVFGEQSHCKVIAYFS